MGPSLLCPSPLRSHSMDSSPWFNSRSVTLASSQPYLHAGSGSTWTLGFLHGLLFSFGWTSTWSTPMVGFLSWPWSSPWFLVFHMALYLWSIHGLVSLRALVLSLDLVFSSELGSSTGIMHVNTTDLEVQISRWYWMHSLAHSTVSSHIHMDFNFTWIFLQLVFLMALHPYGFDFYTSFDIHRDLVPHRPWTSGTVL